MISTEIKYFSRFELINTIMLVNSDYLLKKERKKEVTSAREYTLNSIKNNHSDHIIFPSFLLY